MVRRKFIPLRDFSSLRLVVWLVLSLRQFLLQERNLSFQVFDLGILLVKLIVGFSKLLAARHKPLVLLFELLNSEAQFLLQLDHLCKLLSTWFLLQCFDLLLHLLVQFPQAFKSGGHFLLLRCNFAIFFKKVLNLCL